MTLNDVILAQTVYYIDNKKNYYRYRNASILSHPITLEYIKTYDIVASFKKLITNSMPNANKADHSLFTKFMDKLNHIQMAEFDKSQSKVTPQIINMTSSVDHTLNEIQIVFSQVIDELVNAKYELAEKEHEMVGLRSATRPVSSRLQSAHQASLEAKMKEKEELMSRKEGSLDKKEGLLREREKSLTSKESQVRASERAVEEEKRWVKAEGEKVKKEREELVEDQRN